MKVKEMRTKSSKELETMLQDLRTKLAQTHVDMRVKETPNVKQIKAIKRDIARVLTLQREAQVKDMEKTNE
jgi:large subunit ribosomal protein L29